MRSDKEFKQWTRERDEAVYSFNVEKFKKFHAKWTEKGIYDKPLPSDEVIEVAMRKMVLCLADPDPDKLKEAIDWLTERGMKPYID